MQLLNVLTGPWAIVPEKLVELQGIYAAHVRGETPDFKAIEARIGRPLANELKEYEVHDGGVAVLSVEGVIAPKANMFTRVSGGATAQQLKTQLSAAVADEKVRSVVLAIDSPGGSVFGTPELAALVRELSAVKPIVALSDATMASAAYWVASGADRIFISGPTVQVGSIGVVATHDWRPDRAATTTEVTAGRYKRIASNNAPLSEEGRAYLQAQVDEIYQVFVDVVAAHRGASVDAVLENMADGRIFIGRQALQAGLVDGIMSMEVLIRQLATDPWRFGRTRSQAGGPRLVSRSIYTVPDMPRPVGNVSVPSAPAPAPAGAAATAPAPAPAAPAPLPWQDAWHAEARKYAAEYGVGLEVAYRFTAVWGTPEDVRRRQPWLRDAETFAGAAGGNLEAALRSTRARTELREPAGLTGLDVWRAEWQREARELSARTGESMASALQNTAHLPAARKAQELASGKGAPR